MSNVPTIVKPLLFNWQCLIAQTVTTTSPPGFTKPSGIGGIVGGIFGGIVVGCLISSLIFYKRKGGPNIKYVKPKGAGVPRSGSVRSGLPPLTPIE